MTGSELLIKFYSMNENQKMLLRFTEDMNKKKCKYEENMIALVEVIGIEDNKIMVWTNEKLFKKHNVLLETKRWVSIRDINNAKPYSEEFLRLDSKILYYEKDEEITDFEVIII